MQKINLEKIKLDENGQVRFDFTASKKVFEPHDLTMKYGNYLSDVDFVIEEDDRIICVEYKNSAVKDASFPGAFQEKVSRPEFRQKLARKFYGTLWMIWACNKNPENKPVHYVALLETNPVMDAALKKKLEAKMIKQLPFEYENDSRVRQHVIGSFKVIDMEQWGELYPQYPVSYIR